MRYLKFDPGDPCYLVVMFFPLFFLTQPSWQHPGLFTQAPPPGIVLFFNILGDDLRLGPGPGLAGWSAGFPRKANCAHLEWNVHYVALSE